MAYVVPRIDRHLITSYIAARHWLKMADLPETSKDGLITSNFGEGVEHTF